MRMHSQTIPVIMVMVVIACTPTRRNALYAQEQTPTPTPEQQQAAADENTPADADADSVSDMDLLLPEHAKLLGSAESYTRKQVTPHLQDADAEVKKAAQEMLALMEATRKAIPSRDELAGKWKVRSLQANDLGAYAYPYFPCDLIAEGPKGLVLNKDKGSQRRVGLLIHDEATEDAEADESLPPSLLFLGGSYYSDEPPRGYSALMGDPDTAMGTERDSVGFLYALSPTRLMLIFAPLNARSEIYELIK